MLFTENEKKKKEKNLGKVQHARLKALTTFVEPKKVF